MMARLRDEPRIGVDTESNGLYRYRERVCLIQISTADADYLVDPLAVDVRPLAEIFASSDIEKVFHAGEYDIGCLRRDFGFSFRRLFDTMVAARTLGLKRLGLAALVEEFAGVRLNKGMQQSDWGRRPLSPEQLRYAALDSHYLLPLRDTLASRLAESGRLRQAQECFEGLCNCEWHGRSFDPEDYLRLRAGPKLERVELAILRELLIWREAKARALDRPPFRVATNEMLVKVARMQPRSREALRLMFRTRGGPVCRFADEVLAAVGRGLRLAQKGWQPPRRQARERVSRFERCYMALQDWKELEAARLGLPPSEVVADTALRRIAECMPRTMDDLAALGCVPVPSLETYGGTILDIVEAEHAGPGMKVQP